MRRFLPFLVLLVLLVFPGTAPAPDIYKAFLDENKPAHRAIKETLALIEKNPNDGSLYNDLGCLIAWDGFWRDALRNFDKAAELSPKDSRPAFNAGLVEAWLGNWSSARSRFKKAVKIDPGNWPAWWMVGYAEEQLGNPDAAVEAYKRSLRVDTSLFDIRKNPFAATTRLKGRVLLETYGSRMIRAALPREEQLEDQERIARFFQPTRATAPPAPSAAVAPPGAAAEGQVPAAAAGPVVTTIPQTNPQKAGAVAPPGRTSPPSRGIPAQPRGAPAVSPSPPTPPPALPPATSPAAGPGALPVMTPTPEPPDG